MKPGRAQSHPDSSTPLWDYKTAKTCTICMCIQAALWYSSSPTLHRCLNISVHKSLIWLFYILCLIIIVNYFCESFCFFENIISNNPIKRKVFYTFDFKIIYFILPMLIGYKKRPHQHNPPKPRFRRIRHRRFNDSQILWTHRRTRHKHRRVGRVFYYGNARGVGGGSFELEIYLQNLENAN